MKVTFNGRIPFPILVIGTVVLGLLCALGSTTSPPRRGLAFIATAGRGNIRWRSAGLHRLGSSFPALLQEDVQGIPNLFEVLVLAPVEDVADVLAELPRNP